MVKKPFFCFYNSIIFHSDFKYINLTLKLHNLKYCLESNLIELNLDKEIKQVKNSEILIFYHSSLIFEFLFLYKSYTVKLNYIERCIILNNF